MRFYPNSRNRAGIEKDIGNLYYDGEHLTDMEKGEIFDEKYRVVAVSDQNLVLRGEQSGKVLTINAAEYGAPITEEEYPVGKLVALSDPSSETEN